MWGFDEEISYCLKLFSGEILPDKRFNFCRDKRRLFLNEMPAEIQNKIIQFFKKNKILIMSDLIKGRGGLSANWMLVTSMNYNTNKINWTLHEINQVMNFYGSGDVKISKKGSLSIGKITMQRKGGTLIPQNYNLSLTL